MPYRVEEGSLYYDERLLGPATALYADPTELREVGEEQGVRHVRLYPRTTPPDLVFAVGDLVVGGELKRGSDFWNSWTSRRLARQMRSLLRECGRGLLAVQGELPERWNGEVDEVRLAREMTELQTAGVIVLWSAPLEDLELVKVLGGVRQGLAGRPPAALAGSDRTGYSSSKMGPGWLLRAVPGVGSVIEERLRKRYGTALAAFEEIDGWPELKVGKGVVKRGKEGLE